MLGLQGLVSPDAVAPATAPRYHPLGPRQTAVVGAANTPMVR